MKALSLIGPRAVGVTDVDPVRRPGDGEVLVRMHGLGLCGSDLSRFLGHRAVPSFPWTIGHEGFGAIVEAGHGVDASRIGQTVVIEPIIGCGTCALCRGGSSSLCARRRVLGMTEPGVAREYIVLPASHVHAAPAGWSARQLGCVEPLAVATKAVERSRVAADARVLIIGGGAQGLFIAMLLRARTAHVALSEINADKAEFAASLGIELAGPERTENDVVFEASGSAGGWRSALAAVAPGGTIMIVGMGTAPLDATSEDLVLRQISVLTSYVYDHPHDFPKALEAIATGAVDASAVVSNLVEVAHAQAAHELALGSAGKVVLSFADWNAS